jgi:hypothetical protein
MFVYCFFFFSAMIIYLLCGRTHIFSPARMSR